MELANVLNFAAWHTSPGAYTQREQAMRSTAARIHACLCYPAALLRGANESLHILER
jgi:hypothetical protein